MRHRALGDARGRPQVHVERAREIGVELVAADGRRIGAVRVPGLGAATRVRVPLDAWAGVEVRSVELVARGELATSIGYQVDDVRIDPKTGTSTFTLTLVEGRNRQIRRSLLILGFPVRRLVRERFGKALHHLISHGARFVA